MDRWIGGWQIDSAVSLSLGASYTGGREGFKSGQKRPNSRPLLLQPAEPKFASTGHTKQTTFAER